LQFLCILVVSYRASKS